MRRAYVASTLRWWHDGERDRGGVEEHKVLEVVDKGGQTVGGGRGQRRPGIDKERGLWGGLGDVGGGESGKREQL